MTSDVEFEARLRQMAAAIEVPQPSEECLRSILAALGARPVPVSHSRARRPVRILMGMALAASIGGLLVTVVTTRRAEQEPAARFVMLWPEDLMAQVQDGASLPDSETILTLDGTALTPGLWVYRRRPIGGPPGRPEWTDTLSIREGTHQGEAAWTVSWRRGPFHREQIDQAETLYVRRADLWPLSRFYRFAGRQTVRQVFRPDSTVLVSEDHGQTRVVSVSGFSPAGGAVISGWSASRYLVQALPLHRTWRGNIRIIGIGSNGQVVDFRMPLQVLREETITVPAGTFDCWAVAMGTQRPAFVFWVSKRERWIVKEGLGPAEEIGPDVVGSERVLISATP